MISILLPNLHGGGAERVAVNLANTWASWGYDVELILMSRSGEFLEALEQDISVFTLDCTRIRSVPIKLKAYLKERKPSVLLANMWPLTTAAALAWRLAGKPGKLFLCEHIALIDHVQRDLQLPLFLVKAVLMLSYPSASAVLAVSGGVARNVARLSGIPESRIKVIYNPVVSEHLPAIDRNHDSIRRGTLWSGSFQKHILAVGSLKSQKNHRLLLRAFAKVVGDLDAGLVILGEGGLRAILERDILELGLSGRVFMPGFQSDPKAWYGLADLFVLSSDFEGFANVLPEALAFGVAIVSTDCRHGPSEILSGGRYGELVKVGSVEHLAAGMRKALARRWDRDALQRRALDFSIPKQAKMYLELFNA